MTKVYWWPSIVVWFASVMFFIAAHVTGSSTFKAVFVVLIWLSILSLVVQRIIFHFVKKNRLKDTPRGFEWCTALVDGLGRTRYQPTLPDGRRFYATGMNNWLSGKVDSETNRPFVCMFKHDAKTWAVNKYLEEQKENRKRLAERLTPKFQDQYRADEG